MSFKLYQGDAFTVMSEFEENSFQAIVTDPPYGVKEYTATEIDKMRNKNGGIWRIPRVYDGCERALMPRFTVLTDKDIEELRKFFLEFGKQAFRIVVPGAHMIVASNPLLSHHVIASIASSGWEYRATMIRLVRTLRGGDRPKGAEQEFPDVSVTPRGCWEPWLIFRKPIEEKTVAQNLRKWRTGGLRRFSDQSPFLDIVQVEKTPKVERDISGHPSVKSQELMRLIVRSSLPLGEGRILDPFAGCGSTLAAAEYLGIESVGIEVDQEYYQQALEAIPKLAKIKTRPYFTRVGQAVAAIDDFE